MRDIKNPSRKINNNKNNNKNSGGNLFPGPGGDGDLFAPGAGSRPNPRPNFDFPPPLRAINEFIQPEEYDLQNWFNNLRGNSSSPSNFANNAPNFNFPTSSFSRKSTSSSGPGNNLFGWQVAELTREKVKDGDFVTETKNDTIYNLPESTEIELGDGSIENLGAGSIDLLDVDNITKQEQEDVVLEKIKEQYGFEDIKDSFNEGYIPDSVYFFYGGDSENFARAVELLGSDADNREFAAFLLSDLGRQVMTSNRLSIHVETGDIFYENHNTGENFFNFLVAQQNGQAAFIPKKFSYWNGIEDHISQFLPAFSLDDVEKYEKYLFYRFNDYVKACGSHRRKNRHTRKFKDSVGMQKVEERTKQFLVEKIVHGVEFKNPYNIEVEKKQK